MVEGVTPLCFLFFSHMFKIHKFNFLLAMHCILNNNHPMHVVNVLKFMEVIFC